MNNDQRMQQFARNVQDLTGPQREARAREYEQKLPPIAVGQNKARVAAGNVDLPLQQPPDHGAMAPPLVRAPVSADRSRKRREKRGEEQ